MHIRILLLHLLSFCLLAPVSLLAQSLDLSGAWKGYIETPGPRLEIQIKLQKLDDGYKGTLDIPVQGIADMPLDDLAVVGDSLFFRLTQVPGNAHFSGHASADGLRIRGTFSQGGFDMPMVLERPDALTGRKEAERVEEALAFIRHFADSVRAARAVPGLAVAIWYRGQPVLVEGFGYTDPDQSRKVDGETLFAIGSCTKAFTAADLALLADDGLLEWERPLREYLPDFRLKDPFATAEMRPRDLLVHNSGLPRHDLLWYATSYTREMLYQRLRYLDDVMPANVNAIFSTRYAIRKQIQDADLVVGAVLIPGAKAPKLVLREDLGSMKPGSVIVDVAVDQGGCIETTKPTTHHAPTYVVDGVIHYGVANMPGGVPRTSTLALTNATLPYAMALANKGWQAACADDPALKLGVNVVSGHVTYPHVAEAFGMEVRNVDDFLAPTTQV